MVLSSLLSSIPHQPFLTVFELSLLHSRLAQTFVYAMILTILLASVFKGH